MEVTEGWLRRNETDSMGPALPITLKPKNRDRFIKIDSSFTKRGVES
jgi:hypothetical protein